MSDKNTYAIFYINQKLDQIIKDIDTLKQEVVKCNKRLDVFDYSYDYKAAAKKILEDKYPTIPEIV